MNIINKSLNLINDIINNTGAQNLNFYQDILKMVSLLYENKFSVAIFFCENTDYCLKSAIKNNEFISDYSLKNNKKIFLFDEKKSIFKTQEDDLFYKNTLVVKLAIKNSVFGYATLSFNEKINDDVPSAREMRTR